MNVRLLLACFLVASSLTAQQILVVDPNGGTPYKTIREARWVAQPGDSIHIRAGVFYEDISLRSGIHYIGIAPNPGDVELRGRVLVYDLPFGTTTRLANMRIQNGGEALRLLVRPTTPAGSLALDRVWVRGVVEFAGHPGLLSMTSCRVESLGRAVVLLKDVQRVAIHDCEFIANFANYSLTPFAPPTLDLRNCDVDISHSRIQGCRWGQLLSHFNPGGPAIRMEDSRVTLSGLSSDVITGGPGHTVAPVTPGGFAMEALNSTLTYSGVTLRNGVGNPAQPILSAGTSIRQLPTSAPVVSIPGGASRGIVTVDLHAEPRATTLTWVGLEVAAGATPFGTFYVDPAAQIGTVLRAIPMSGTAAFSLDLRAAPVSLVGRHFVLQTGSLDPQGHLRLSGPFVGTVGF